MILIITKNNDAVTSRICYWLIYFKKEFKIVSEEDDLNLLHVDKDVVIINNITRNYILDLSTIKKTLYRQGDFYVNKDIVIKDEVHLSDYLNRERMVLQDFIYYKIENVEHYGHPLYANLNKLVVLDKALKYNLHVPNYIYTSIKQSLISFHKKHSNLITKSILPAYSMRVENNFFGSYTEKLDVEEINELDDTFYPTFFQEMINKEFEIRVFYLEKRFYSIAIFSQNNNKTLIDYRNYDGEIPNRNIPFKIPLDVEMKLQNLIDDLSLGYCSIDLIYGKDKKFYFLEINPIGQFGNVSYYGNYFLEMKLAELL